MDEIPAQDATRLLQRAGEGDSEARSALLALLYRELRDLAQSSMRGERRDHTLQPTALVHEAWLRLAQAEEPPHWRSRAHFLGAAATTMRRVLVDHARRRRTDKRGADAPRIELDDALVGPDSPELDLLALDEALDRLGRRDEELARLVELRFFGGLTNEETARVLGLSTRQVEGGWVAARGWLRRELSTRGGA
jgi:RNA polymerase sigma factor (TIGR02999 family)